MGHSNHLLSPKETHATKKKGSFFIFLVKIQLSLQSILKIWPNFQYHKIEREKKNPTKQLIETFGVFLIGISIFQFTLLY